MSGDVQPRKRNKDKKRRRDDEETRPTGVHATKMGPDDIQLHVHSDHGTGGHWCAKIFFFSLLAVLLGLIGLILLENRGLADLDTPLSESRFADMLEGWVDEEREVHDEHDVHLPDSHEHDDEDHDEHDEHDDGEEEHDQEDDEPLNSKENDHQEQDEDEIDLQKDDPEDDKETDEGFDESTENVATADEDDDERLCTIPKCQKLTIDAVNDFDANARVTNKSTPVHDIEKRSIDENDVRQNEVFQEMPDAQVTVKQLEEQVDDLVENFNKLAKTLNRSPINEANTKEIHFSSSKKDENDDDNDDNDDNDEGNDKIDDDDEDENEVENDDQADEDEDEDDNKNEDNDEDEGIVDQDNDELNNDVDEVSKFDDEDTTDDDQTTEPALDDDENEIESNDDQPAEEQEEPEDESSSQIDRSGPASAVTEDQLLQDDIRRANKMLTENPQSALTIFEEIHQTHPTSSAALYSLAKALDHMAELNRSNQLLKRAIIEYEKYLEFGANLSDTDFKTAAERCINRMRFMGEHLKAVPVHEKLIERFDDNPYYRNQLAVTYLLVNRLADAKYVLHKTLERWRDDGFAAVHYGFVLKNLDKNLEHAVIFLRQGIESGANGTSDGRFYFNLGDALIRLGRHDEAKQVFQMAAEKKLFPSQYQRSLYNVDHLKARPFWTLAETGYKHEFRLLEQNWKQIRDEGLSILSNDGYFTDEAENLRDTGVWKQFELFARGNRNQENCKRTPITCKLIETFPAARFCKRGQVKFSVMHPNTHVWPHCGPTNCRLRAHLGLKMADKTSIRVATDTRTWSEGKIMVFDDSFEHEVWHNGTTYRLILIVDVWHPDLTADEKKTLVPI